MTRPSIMFRVLEVLGRTPFTLQTALDANPRLPETKQTHPLNDEGDRWQRPPSDFEYKKFQTVNGLGA